MASKSQVDPIHKWKQTRRGRAVTGLAAGLLAYAAASLAIDSGSLWHYLLAIILTVVTIWSFVKAVKPNVRS